MRENSFEKKTKLASKVKIGYLIFLGKLEMKKKTKKVLLDWKKD